MDYQSKKDVNVAAEQAKMDGFCELKDGAKRFKKGA